jgi:GTP-binding protein Era
MPEGPLLYPPDSVVDVPRGEWIAELVREELLARTRDEVPYSIATRVAEESADEVAVEIVVERDSQKGIVIGKNGAVLSAVRRLVVRQMPRGVRLRLLVVVDPHWQRRPERVERLGY